MKGKVPVLDAQASRVGSPPPPPFSVTRSRWGGGGMAGRVLFGDPKRGRGVALASQSCELESHLILASKIHGLESHLSSASYFGELFRQGIPAPQFGRVLLQANLADLLAGF
jgi:hypothetical protein